MFEPDELENPLQVFIEFFEKFFKKWQGMDSGVVSAEIQVIFFESIREELTV